jgi:hypothetical protein
MKHIHHIIPKHSGGSDDPSNLIELTVEEHAEAHKILWEKYGKIEDKIAWLGLLKIIERKDILTELSKKPKSDEHKRKISEAHKGKSKPWLIGNKNASVGKDRNLSEEHKKNISQSKIGKKRKEFGDEWKLALKLAKNKLPIVTCPHCGLTSRGPNMKRYHFENCKWKS